MKNVILVLLVVCLGNSVLAQNIYNNPNSSTALVDSFLYNP